MHDKLKIAISIDDVNPSDNFGIIDTPVDKYLTELHNEFGAKFTLFIPSHYHLLPYTKLSDNQKWIDKLQETKMYELAAHGHQHMTPNKELYGEMEFAIINASQCTDRIKEMLFEWDKVGYKPKGWKNPGWKCNPDCVKLLSPHFDYVSLHKQHNYDMTWPNIKMIFGGNDICEEIDLIIEDGILLFQSHIYGDWNKNVWNEKNTNILKRTLSFLDDNYNTEYVTLCEL